mmetsp:Transcript_59548/g.105815  ORF Transcript_59548/g.105815 Transcript_59548/m.105815 type:complete len:198 (-) Transcript_59548:87-680(-)
MPFIPKFERKIDMGSTANPFAAARFETLQTENKAQAAQMFELEGTNLEDLLESFEFHRSLLPPKKGGKPKLGFKGPPPVISSPERTIGPYDPSLQETYGMGQKTYHWREVGGAGDHHKTLWGGLDVSRPQTSLPPSRGGSQASLHGVRSGGGGSRAASASGRSRTSRRSLSAASSVLLKSEIEEAVRKEISRISTPA